MAQKVRFLTTSAGDYGLANTGDELVVTNAVATKLEKAGTVEVLGDAGDEEVSAPQSGSVRIADQTGTNATAGDTDEKNPTGPDKAARKTARTAAKKGKK
jgi:hypothetical protein